MFATIGLSVLGVIANVFEALAAPYNYDPNLIERIWYFWYAYAGYVQWSIFFLSLIFLMWLTYRLARNLHALAPGRFTLSPTYAVGYYLVPIANIIMPPRITGLIAKDTFAVAKIPTSLNALIGWWGGTFLLTALLSNVATVVAANAGAFDENVVFDETAYVSALWLGAAASFVNIVSCYFMLRVFAPIVRAQADLVSGTERPSAPIKL